MMVENTDNGNQLVTKGLVFLSGNGVEKDEVAAFRYFLQAAQLQDPMGEFMVGVCYDQGWGTEANASEAFRYFERAAEKGLPEAQFNLGVYLQFSELYLSDISRAVGEYKKASSQGLPEAIYNYAVCTEFGVGTNKDPNLAQELYAAVAERFPQANNRLKKKSEISQGFITLLSGLLAAVIGIGASCLSIKDASAHGGRSTVYYGTATFGIIQIFRGFISIVNGLEKSVALPDPNYLFIKRRLDRLVTVNLFEAQTHENDEIKNKNDSQMSPSSLTTNIEEKAKNENEWMLIDFSGKKLTSEQLYATLPNVPFFLDLSNSPIRDDIISSLRGNPNLRGIKLYGCKKITELSLQYLATCPNLQKLMLGNIGIAQTNRYVINPDAVIIQFPNYYPASDTWLQIISRMTQLKALFFQGCINFTDQGIALLSNLTQLEYINVISCNQLTDSGYQFLSALPHLKQVGIGSKKMTGHVLSYLEHTLSLTSISLFNPKKVDDNDIAILQKLPLLQELDCKMCYRTSQTQVLRWMDQLSGCLVSLSPRTGRILKIRMFFWVFYSILVGILAVTFLASFFRH